MLKYLLRNWTIFARILIQCDIGHPVPNLYSSGQRERSEEVLTDVCILGTFFSFSELKILEILNMHFVGWLDIFVAMINKQV